MEKTLVGVTHNANLTPTQTNPGSKISTKKLAQKLGVECQTIRAGYCRKGHYLGLIPVTIANRQLRWDEGDADRVLSGETIIGGARNAEQVNSDRSAKARAAAKSVATRREKRAAAEAERLPSSEVA